MTFAIGSLVGIGGLGHIRPRAAQSTRVTIAFHAKQRRKSEVVFSA